jgi:phage terminase small subunit
MKNKVPPPTHLSVKSAALWARLVSDYRLDAPGLALLQVACEALDRLEQAREVLERDGLTIGEGGSTRRHPALDIEKQSASIFLRAWRDLGWDKTESPLAGAS